MVRFDYNLIYGFLVTQLLSWYQKAVCYPFASASMSLLKSCMSLITC